MTASAGTIPPPVSWAQRNDLVYIVIDVECKDIEHKVTESSFYFKGTNVLDESKKYEVTLNFFKPIDTERVTNKNIGRCVEFTIYKKEAGPYWPALIAEKSKLHFLKANFSKWRNESDDEEEGGMADMMGMGGNNFPLMGNQDWNNKFDDFNVDDDDEDSDDNIPSLSQNDDDDDDNAAEKSDNKKEEK